MVIAFGLAAGRRRLFATLENPACKKLDAECGGAGEVLIAGAVTRCLHCRNGCDSWSAAGSCSCGLRYSSREGLLRRANIFAGD